MFHFQRFAIARAAAAVALALAGACLACACLATSMARAQAPAEPAVPEAGTTGVAPASGSNLLNPSISVIGWFQGEASDRTSDEGSSAFALREAEIGFQAAVDPYSRAEFYVAVSQEEGVDLEEGLISFLSLPAGLSAKLGKFRGSFGKFNRTHPPETPFADRPLAAERFLGEEGLAAAGLSVAWLVPNPVGVYLNLDLEATATPEESPAFAPYRGQDLLYLARTSAYFDLGEASNVTLGTSYANGANGFAYADPLGDRHPRALRSQLYGVDATFRWKNPRRAIYRSLLVQAEVMERAAEPLTGPSVVSRGLYAYADYQFARRWHAGARYDWSEDPAQSGVRARGGLGFLTFTPSEFSLLSLQASSHDQNDGWNETRYYLKTTFNIGPHGAHPF